MTPAQVQTALSDAQLAMTVLTPFASALGPGGVLAAGIGSAAVTAITAAVNAGTDVTDAQLLAIKAADQAAIADDLAAQKAAGAP